MLGDPSIRLRRSIIDGNILLVKRLLRRFPDLLTNINPENGWSSLHYASYHGRYLICAFLIQIGHDRHEILKTFDNDTCVHLAVMNGHEQTAHLLLQHFPQFINKKGNFGRTPTHIACIHDFNQSLSLLIGVGAQLSITDDNGDSPLHLCLAFGSINCMRVLILEGDIQDEQIRNKDGWQPSDVAMTFELKKLYKTLLKEVHASGITKKPSYQSFRTPVLPPKSSFEDGPSPIYSMNSPTVSLFSQANVFNNLSRISNSRRASIANNITTSISNSGVVNNRSTDELVSPSNLNVNLSNSYAKNTSKSPIARAASFTTLLASVDPIFSKGNNKQRSDTQGKRDFHLPSLTATNFRNTDTHISHLSHVDKQHTGSAVNPSPRRSLNFLREPDGRSLSSNHDELTQTIFRSNSNTNLFSKYLNSNTNEKGKTQDSQLKSAPNSSETKDVTNIYNFQHGGNSDSLGLRLSNTTFDKSNISSEDSLHSPFDPKDTKNGGQKKLEKPVLHRIDTSGGAADTTSKPRRKISLLNIPVAKIRDDIISTSGDDDKNSA